MVDADILLRSVRLATNAIKDSLDSDKAVISATATGAITASDIYMFYDKIERCVENAIEMLAIENGQ